MNRFPATEPASDPRNGTDLYDLIALVGELTDLICDENALLARGLPASISQNVAHKAMLSAALGDWLVRIRRGDDAFVHADRAAVLVLVDGLRHLQAEMAENMSRLGHAMAVTRRRIEAIMSAVREQTGTRGTYGRDGVRERGRERAGFGDAHIA